MTNIERCSYCERTFDDTEESFTSVGGHIVCAHCAAEELKSLRQQLEGTAAGIRRYLTDALHHFERGEHQSARAYVASALASLDALRGQYDGATPPNKREGS